MSEDELKAIERQWRHGCADVGPLVAEVRRLRALVERAETNGCGEYGIRSNCPWCNFAIGNWKRNHAPECPAFTEDRGLR